MRWLTCVASAAFLLPLLSTRAAAAAPPQADPVKILRALEYGTEYELTLSVPETGETFQKKGEFWAFQQLAFRCLSADGKGAFTAVIRLPETGHKFTLRTRGLADDLYVVRILQLHKPFAKWHKKACAGVKNSPDVVVGRPHQPSKGAVAFDRVPAYLLSAVAAAAVKYEEKRPELSLRVREEESCLYFPPAGESPWRVTRDGDKLFVRTWCVDRMYAATFEVEFRKVGNGDAEWEYVRLRGEEHFKGE